MITSGYQRMNQSRLLRKSRFFYTESEEYRNGENKKEETAMKEFTFTYPTKVYFGEAYGGLSLKRGVSEAAMVKDSESKVI